VIVVVYAALVVAIVTATVVQAVYVHDVAVIAVSDGAIGVPDRPTAAGVADDFDVAVVAVAVVAVPRAASASASASFETVGLAVGPYLLHYRLYRKQLQTEVHPRRPTRGPVSDQSQHF